MLYTLEKEQLIELCATFPKTADLLQEYCLEQMVHLNETRQQKLHLHSGNQVNHFYRKNQVFMEKRAKIDDDFGI